MNPIANLTGKKFKELNVGELIEVIEAYKDQNKYFDSPRFSSWVKRTTKPHDVLIWFETSINPVSELTKFYGYWTK